VRQAARFVGAPFRWVLIGALRLYRWGVAPFLGQHCRFHPSCSAYALDAVQVHGAAKGSLLAAWRVLRCSPLTDGGLDPVPAPGRWRGVEYDGVTHEDLEMAS
jgi:putative membrane protein insertion efficiency factor